MALTNLPQATLPVPPVSAVRGLDGAGAAHALTLALALNPARTRSRCASTLSACFSRMCLSTYSLATNSFGLTLLPHLRRARRTADRTPMTPDSLQAVQTNQRTPLRPRSFRGSLLPRLWLPVVQRALRVRASCGAALPHETSKPSTTTALRMKQPGRVTLPQQPQPCRLPPRAVHTQGSNSCSPAPLRPRGHANTEPGRPALVVVELHDLLLNPVVDRLCHLHAGAQLSRASLTAGRRAHCPCRAHSGLRAGRARPCLQACAPPRR